LHLLLHRSYCILTSLTLYYFHYLSLSNGTAVGF
jgi:hypothetical protein